MTQHVAWSPVKGIDVWQRYVMTYQLWEWSDAQRHRWFWCGPVKCPLHQLLIMKWLREQISKLTICWHISKWCDPFKRIEEAEGRSDILSVLCRRDYSQTGHIFQPLFSCWQKCLNRRIVPKLTHVFGTCMKDSTRIIGVFEVNIRTAIETRSRIG